MNFSSINYKKLGLILLFILIIVVVGYFIFNIFFKSTVPPLPGTDTPGNTMGNGLPQAGNGTGTATNDIEGGLPGPGTVTQPGGSATDPNNPNAAANNQISDQAAYAAQNASGQLQFFNSADSRFYTVDGQGKLISLSDKRFVGVSNVVWSPVQHKAILEYPDGSKIRYDFDTEEQITLPKHWEGFNFSPSGDKIVAKSIGLDPENRWLVVANDDGSQAKTLEPLGENGDDVIASWSPNNQTVAMYVDGIDFNRKEVFFIGQNGENFKSMETEGRGFEPLWAPKGDQLLYSVYSADNDYKPTLWVAGAQGDTIGADRRPLNLNTWADKCSFSQSALYCAVPSNLERGAGMLSSSSVTTGDLLYRINPANGVKELIGTDASYSMRNLSVTPDGNYLYFTDANNVLRKIKIR